MAEQISVGQGRIAHRAARGAEATGDRCREFDGVVRRYHRQAYRVAYRMTGSAADAEDLTQETFLRAFRFYGNYRPELPLEGWLYRIMSNLFIDSCRRRPKVELRSLDQPTEGHCGRWTLLLEIPDLDADPERLVLAEVLDERVQGALMSLPRVYRLAIILADIEGLSYQEVSTAMACPIGAVRSRLHRGRKLLRSRLLCA